MKITLAAILITSTLLSACTTVVMTEVIETRPTTVVNATYFHQPQCYWAETPVYGYADIYRDGYSHVRIREVAYVDRQRRCN
jgi:hypothetical protein